MNQVHKTAEEFAADESFQDYCLGKSSRNSRKWSKYVEKNSSQHEIIVEAKMLVLLFSPNELVVSKPSLTRKHSKKSLILKSCAFLLVLIVATLVISQYQNKQVKFETINVIAEGQNQSILLSDLTNVELREDSKLVFKESWENSKVRSVELTGEAYFDVRKSNINGKTFEVQLDNGVVSVLGTKFLVKSTPSYTQIILEEGRVNYTIKEKKYELNPGDVLMYNEEMVSIHHKKEISTYDSWRKHELSFQNTPIEDVINTINNSYNLEVSIGSKRFKNRKITTTIRQNDPILLLQSIAAIYEMEIDIQEPKIVLK